MIAFERTALNAPSVNLFFYSTKALTVISVNAVFNASYGLFCILNIGISKVPTNIQTK
jgi:hypothetical protein